MYPNRLKLAILDSHPLILKGLKSIFESCPDIEVEGTFEDSDELLESMDERHYDVIIAEYFLEQGDLGGAELIPVLIQRQPRARILVFSASQDPGIVALALRLGAHGYVNKQARDEIIVRALRRVHAGNRYIDPTLQHLLPESLAPIASHIARGENSESRIRALLHSAELSPSEYSVLHNFVAGANVMEIAARLCKSPKTISSQKAAAFRKLGVTTDNGLYRLVGKTVDTTSHSRTATKNCPRIGRC
ncbi:MAG: response regulator transcription factor [Achromobacter sp.]|uniref:response regulator transcription factor n=1 Tax=Achromobacter sp. TaxID=134375 RepID=UPI003CFCE620